MALLAFCWLIIELRIIPNGFLKWFYLSFYIHPLFLFFCQIFLWLNEVQKLAVLLILTPFKITLFIALLISKFLKRVAIILFSFAIKKIKKPEFFAADDHEVNQGDAGGVVNSQEFESGAATVNTSDRSSTRLIANRPLLTWNPGRKRRANLAIQPELQSSNSSWLNEFLLSDYYTKCLSTYYSDDAGNLSSHGQKDTWSSDIDHGLHPGINQGFSLKLQDFEPQLDEEMLRMSYEGDDLPDHRAYLVSDLSQTNVLVDVCSPSPCGSDSPEIALEPEQRLSSDKVSEKDAYSRSFHQKYTERMRWFDVLYHDRLCGIRHPIQHVMNPSAKISTKKILRSLESDLELVYIAKLCLIWEALHYQYRKVESLAELSDGNLLLFNADISEKFQKFKIILERFMEGEKCHHKKYLDFICDRISFKGLLQIPNVTGFVKKQENRSMPQAGEEAMIKANELLKVIEKCIQVFWLYVEKDHNKNDKKYVKVISWRTRPPVEDPRDLHLLYHLTDALRKKLLLLHGMQAKKKCWFRRRSVKPVQEECDHEKNMDQLVFGAIDLELVRKVTKMPTISTSHLAWCQHKLNNVEFRQGRMFRTPATCLFPSS